MKWVLLPLVLLLPLNIFGQTAAYEVPVNYRIHYYYKVLQKASSAQQVKPDKKAMKVLQADGCIFVDSGSFSQEAQEGYDSIWNVNKTYRTGAFFVHGTEVNNEEYKRFLQAEASAANYPDTLVWKDPQLADHPYIHYYFQHIAYSKYPVVGISQEQALRYCAWKKNQLQQLFKNKGIQGYRIEVSLPEDAEWQAVYNRLFPKWLQQQKRAKNQQFLLPNATAYVLGGTGYRANFGDITSLRIQNLRLPFANYSSGGILTPSLSYPSVFGVYNLLGNVAEWTSTSAQFNLFNTQEYLYTTANKLVPVNTRIDSALLGKRLHQADAMSRHFAVKGGSWNEEFFFLQPAAVQFKDQSYRAKNLGFRYVVRVFAESTKP